MKKRDERTPMKMSRRSFLKLAGAAGLGMGGILAGCNSSVNGTTAAPTEGTTAPEETTGGNILVENPEVATAPLPKEDKVVRTVCAPNCTGSCAINAYVKDDTIIKVEPGEFPDPSYNRICLKGISNAMQRVYSADRIKYPMKRVGERGEGKWERISWDDAISLLADKFTTLTDQYGSTSISFIAMTGNYGVLPQMLTSRMAASVGGTAFTNFGIMGDLNCNTGFHTTVMVEQEANGWECIKDTKLCIMWGCNYAETAVNDMRFIYEAQKAGMKLVVIDPRFSRTASKADWYIQIRPGTDAAMILGMMQHIVANGWIKEDYIREHTVGAYLVRTDNGKFVRAAELGLGDNEYVVWKDGAAVLRDEKNAGAALTGTYTLKLDGKDVECTPSLQQLVDTLNAEYTPEQAAAICEVPAEDIKKLAEMYVQTDPAELRISQGTNRYWNGHQPTRAVIVLAALTGNIGKYAAGANWAGGTLMRFLFSVPGEWIMPVPGKVSSGLPGTQMFECIAKQQPYPIKLLWCVNYGIGTQTPERNKFVNEVLPQLDFFVVSEKIMTPGAQLADLVLPVTSYYEEECDVVASWSNMYLQRRKQAITPMWETKSDWKAMQMLAEKLGIGEYWQGTEEDACRFILDHSPNPAFNQVDRDALFNDGVASAVFDYPHTPFKEMKFDTPSGKIEIYDETLTELGEACPVHYEPFESNRNEKAKTYPLTFMNCRTVYTAHSQHVDLPWIQEINPEPRLEMNPEDAAARNIADGEMVEVYNDRGSYQVKVKISNEIKPGCLNQAQGWWPKHFTKGHYGEMLHMELNKTQDFLYETNYAPYDNLVEVKKL